MEIVVVFLVSLVLFGTVTFLATWALRGRGFRRTLAVGLAVAEVVEIPNGPNPAGRRGARTTIFGALKRTQPPPGLHEVDPTETNPASSAIRHATPPTSC